MLSNETLVLCYNNVCPPGDADQRREGRHQRPGRPHAGHQGCQWQEHAASRHAHSQGRSKGKHSSPFSSCHLYIERA